MQIFAYILLVKQMRIHKIYEIKKILPALAFGIIASVLVLTYTKNSFDGMAKGINFCLSVLVPSLFPFMFISSFIVNSGVFRLLSKPFGLITKVLFRVPAECGATILLSLIGGYPVGARSVRSLLNKGVINEKQAEKMAYFCICSGPGFLITYVGVSLYGNFQIGLMLLISSIIATVICGVLANFAVKDCKNINNNSNLEINKHISFSNAFMKSVTDASKAVLDMCSMVVLFNVLINFLETLISNNAIKNILYISLEVTTACNVLWNNTSLLVIAFAVGFGGLCVHFQVFQGLGDIKINKIIFFLFRIIQGLLTALLIKILLNFFPIAEEVFANTQNSAVVLSSSNYLGSVMLLITAFSFLYSIKSLKT